MDGQFKSFEKIDLGPMCFWGANFHVVVTKKKKSGENLTKGVLRFFGQNVPQLEKKTIKSCHILIHSWRLPLQSGILKKKNCSPPKTITMLINVDLLDEFEKKKPCLRLVKGTIKITFHNVSKY
jgi:hypothetical protein